MFITFPQFFKSTIFQLLSLVIVSCYITLLLSWKYKGFETAEKFPKIQAVTQEMSRYANIVEVGLHINSFLQFSFTKNEFSIDGTVWFKFPVGTESLNTISQFTLQNALIQQNGDIIYKSDPIVSLQGDYVSISYHFQTLFKTNLNYRLFPIGDHKLNLILQNKSVTPYELTFISKEENFDFSQNILVSNWKPYAKNVQAGYNNPSTNAQDPSMNVSYPCIVFSLDFENIGMRDVISLYFPMFVLFLIGLFSFAISITDVNRLLIIATSLPILVLFRMVIDTLSPSIEYTTHVDFVYYLLVFLSLLILFFQAYVVLALQHSNKDTDVEQQHKRRMLENANACMFMAILMLLIIAMTYNHFRF